MSPKEMRNTSSLSHLCPTRATPYVGVVSSLGQGKLQTNTVAGEMKSCSLGTYFMDANTADDMLLNYSHFMNVSNEMLP